MTLQFYFITAILCTVKIWSIWVNTKGSGPCHVINIDYLRIHRQWMDLIWTSRDEENIKIRWMYTFPKSIWVGFLEREKLFVFLSCFLLYKENVSV